MHEERISAVLSRLRLSGARRVVDLGCGAGTLLVRLVAEEQFERLVGFDIASEAIARAGQQPPLQAALKSGRLSLGTGSFLAPDLTCERFDAAVLLETIEHVPPNRLSLIERSLFTELRPQTLIMTTPNLEYNPLYNLRPGQLRHPAHRFEWTRARFRAWAMGVAARNRYSVKVSGIGLADDQLGPPSQIAVFTRPAAPE